MRLASCGGKERGKIHIWEARSGERVQTLAEHVGTDFAIVWSPGGEMLISGGSDGTLRWWEVQSGQRMRVQEGHQAAVRALKVSPDGNRLASCGDDGAIMLWDLHNGEHLQTLREDPTSDSISRAFGVSPRCKRHHCMPWEPLKKQVLVSNPYSSGGTYS